MGEAFKLYRVYSGWMANAPISVFVVAQNVDDAWRLAKEQFDKEGQEYNHHLVDLLCDDLSHEFVSEVDEG